MGVARLFAIPKYPWRAISPVGGYRRDAGGLVAELVGDLLDDDRGGVAGGSRRLDVDVVAQFSASTHRLEFELLASNAPFERELLQRLVSGTLRSLGTMRRAAPAELSPLIEEAESIVVRVQDALSDELG